MALRNHLTLRSSLKSCVSTGARAVFQPGNGRVFAFPRRPITRAILAWLVVIGVQGAAAAQDQPVTKTWAMAEFGEPLYGEGIDHWPYANPDAPKGGRIVLGTYGTFDTLNTVIMKGEFPGSIGLASDSLMVGSTDEIMAAYGLIAESAEYPADKSWVIFNLRPEARFSDGVPITAEDFKFAFDTYKEHGRPLIRSFIADIESCEVLSEHRVKYVMKTRGSMKPLMIAAGFSPMARHFWKIHDVTQSTLDPPPASGAYAIASVDPGRSITYRRVPDYWGADLPVNRGLNNFDEIRYEYYRDATVQFEAFKAGDIDFRTEGSAKRWATEYDFPAVADGRVVVRTLPLRSPRGLGGYFMNLQRPPFQDRRVRQAINELYDFEAIQRTLLYGHYSRTKSYFPNSDYGASGPPTAEEIAILKPFRDRLRPEVLTEAFEPPVTDGSGRIRDNLRRALALFREAGWTLQDGKLADGNGRQMRFEILTASPETERTTLPFIQNLRRAGIDASLRIMDVAQWRTRIENQDFDIYTARNNFFPPPGTELRIYFGSEVDGDPGTGNHIGYSDRVADALIDRIIAARDLATLKATTRALDRVVLWNFNVVPQFHPDEIWFAYWDKFGYPERTPTYGTGFPATWWIEPERAGRLAGQ
jgi:microcin C transport system substrate-binding protein